MFETYFDKALEVMETLFVSVCTPAYDESNYKGLLVV